MSDILDLANNIAQTKEDIRKAIINKKVTVSTDEPFANYPNKISEIRLASDYSDVVSVDAINLTGKDIKKGDKIWIVPNEISDQSTLYDTEENLIITRDGKNIYTKTKIYNTEDNSSVNNFNTWGYNYNMQLKWSKNNIHADNLSLINPRNMYENIYVCEGYSVNKTSYNSFILINEKTNETITYTGVDISEDAFAYDPIHGILCSYYSSFGYTRIFIVNWSEKTITSLNDSYSTHYIPYEFTSDCKFCITFNSVDNHNYPNIVKFNSDYYFTVQNPKNFNEDFVKLFDRSDVLCTYNRIDDVLYLYDASSKYIMAYKYYPETEKFELLNKVQLNYRYASSSNAYNNNPIGSADGKVLGSYSQYAKITNQTKLYKATSTLQMTNTENALSGIAEENATNNQSFKVGVSLGPTTVLTATTNTENATITVE